MKITKQSRRDAKSLFQICRPEGLLNENSIRQAVDELISRKPRGYLAVLTQLQRLVKLDLDRRAARIDSAIPLTPEHQNQIRQQLTARYGQGLNFSFNVNPSLLGGVRIKVGSDVYDGTVQGRLSELEQIFETA